MLESCRNAQERWGGVHQLIDRWLHGRHELAAAFAQFRDSLVKTECVVEKQQFCQNLLDYVSTGHFEVYEQLANEAKAFDDERSLQLAKQIYPRIETITEAALSFNDICDASAVANTHLADELHRLGVLLRERFELEDCLIEVMHNSHQQQAELS